MFTIEKKQFQVNDAITMLYTSTTQPNNLRKVLYKFVVTFLFRLNRSVKPNRKNWLQISYLAQK